VYLVLYETSILFELYLSNSLVFVCQSSGWNVNPPVPMEYAQAYLDLIFGLVEKTDEPGRRSSDLAEEDSVVGDAFLSSNRSTASVEDSVVGDAFLSSIRSTASVDKVPRDVSHQDLKESILELIQYQLELALLDHRLFHVRSSVIATAAVLNALEGAMNENPSSFWSSGISLTGLVMKSCRIASEKELEDVRSVLLSSVVSSSDGREGLKDEGIALARSSSHSQFIVASMPDNPPSSPTSASKLFTSPMKMFEHALTPKSVLSRVFVFHHI